MAMTVESFSVRRLVDDLYDKISPLVQENDNVLTVWFADAVTTIDGDESKARLMLMHLLHGAASFTRQGAITLEVREREDAVGNPCIEFTVTDTGVGLTVEEVGRLFDPDKDIDSRGFNGNDGSGLDLAAVWRSCQQMGGSVAVESRLYQGARFTVLLPVSGSELSGVA
jgi:signal transduction histidine kinase